jgi:hypothetical protein
MNTSTANTGSSRTTLGRLLAAALILGSVGAQAGIIPSQGTWTTTLQGRDASGNPVALLNGAGNAPNPGMKYVYDTVLDLTWLANWNAAAGSSFDNGSHTSDGRMTWANAKSWSAGLTAVTKPILAPIAATTSTAARRGVRRDLRWRTCTTTLWGTRGLSTPPAVFSPISG